MNGERISPKGRGAGFNPPNRFDPEHHEIELEAIADDEEYLEHLRRPETEFLPDRSRTVISENQSPDVGFEASLNPYRGCEHGCIYCSKYPLRTRLKWRFLCVLPCEIGDHPSSRKLLQRILGL